jgi:glycine cleavage system H protein
VSETPADLHYTAEHEWVRRSTETTVRVGITDFAQGALGDVVYVDLPEVGTVLAAGDVFGEVESPKTTSELYAPIAAKVVAINGDLEASPDLVNSDPYGEGWLIELQAEAAELDEALHGLLEAEAYRATLDE